MRFNRRLTKIKALSFDLDDTLYSNRQVMIDTDIAMQQYFYELFNRYQCLNFSPTYSHFNHQFWLPFRQQVLQQSPALKHDVTQARYHTYCLGFNVLGLPEQNTEIEAQHAMAHFLVHRNKVDVPNEIHDFLSAAVEKFPIIAISNGNVDTKAIGLDSYFKYIFHAGDNGLQQKPAADMFKIACQKLNISANELLHIGDCGHADIQGATAFGCQTAWVNTYNIGKPINVLATIDLNHVTDLAKIF